MKILIVEDERQLSEALAALLKKSLHEIDAVYNGTDGEDYAMSGVYDAVILDVMLPGKSGVEAYPSPKPLPKATKARLP